MELSFILNVLVATWVCLSAKTHKIVLKNSSYSMYIKKLSSQAIHRSKKGMNKPIPQSEWESKKGKDGI